MNNFKIYQLVKKYKCSVGFFRDKPPTNNWEILIRKSNDSYNIAYQGEESKLFVQYLSVIADIEKIFQITHYIAKKKIRCGMIC